jgi:hypothetical protein
MEYEIIQLFILIRFHFDGKEDYMYYRALRKSLIVLGLVFFVVSCSNNKEDDITNMPSVGILVPAIDWSINDENPMSTPEKTIEQYYYAYKTNDYSLAKTCFFNETSFNIKTFEKYKYVRHNVVKFARRSLGNAITSEKYFFEDFDNDKNIAQVGVNIYYQDGYWDAMAYLLKKINDRWLIYDYKSIFDNSD